MSLISEESKEKTQSCSDLYLQYLYKEMVKVFLLKESIVKSNLHESIKLKLVCILFDNIRKEFTSICEHIDRTLKEKNT